MQQDLSGALNIFEDTAEKSRRDKPPLQQSVMPDKITNKLSSRSKVQANKRIALNKREQPSSKTTKQVSIALLRKNNDQSYTRNTICSFQRAASNKELRVPYSPEISSNIKYMNYLKNSPVQQLNRSYSKPIQIYSKNKQTNHKRSNTLLMDPKIYLTTESSYQNETYQINNSNKQTKSRQKSASNFKTESKAKKQKTATFTDLQEQPSRKRNSQLSEANQNPDFLSFGHEQLNQINHEAQIFPTLKLSQTVNSKLLNDEPLIKDNTESSASFTNYDVPITSFQAHSKDQNQDNKPKLNSFQNEQELKSIQNSSQTLNKLNENIEQIQDSFERDENKQWPEQNGKFLIQSRNHPTYMDTSGTKT